MSRLIISIILTIILFLLAIFASVISPFDLDFQETMMVSPNLIHWFGTDRWGYDQLTLLLHGLKYTLFISVGGALVRVISGILFGLPISLLQKEKMVKIPGLNAIPPFLIVYFLLYRITIDSSLPFSALLTIQFILISIVGIPNVLTQTSSSSREVLKEGFIEAAYSTGASNLRVLFKHVLPQLRERLLLVFITEVITILNLVGQLGIFEIFMGGTKMSLDPVMYHSKSHEIAGLIGQGRLNVDYNRWLLLAPLGFYLVVLSIFYLLQHSLERYYRIKSKIVTHL